MTGSLSVLNVGAGDIEVRFNQHEPEECERAIAMLMDMQRRGYAILVKNADGSYSRVTRIDAKRGLYIISGYPDDAYEDEDEGQVEPVDTPAPEPAAEGAAEAPAAEGQAEEGPMLEGAAEPRVQADSKPKRRGRPRRTAPIAESHAVGVAPSAGG